jgi:hypothetical protein
VASTEQSINYGCNRRKSYRSESGEHFEGVSEQRVEEKCTAVLRRNSKRETIEELLE